MKLQILSMLMTMVSLTACASCSTENDGPIKDGPDIDNPEPDPAPSTGGNGKVLVARNLRSQDMILKQSIFPGKS